MKKRMASRTVGLLAIAIVLGALGGAEAVRADERVDVRFEAGEAAAALAILDLRGSGEEIPESAWKRLVESEGYRRLKKREAAMGRDFTDAEFRDFLLGEEMSGRGGELRATLERWRSADLSAAAERELWDADVARFEEDARKVDGFFRELLAGELDEEEEIETARSFYGSQGPWYTVGWRMSATIERSLGRDALIEASCDPRRWLPTHARALAERGPNAPPNPWSPGLLEALSDPGRGPEESEPEAQPR